MDTPHRRLRSFGISCAGFTLIEVMLVVAIVGILAAIALSAYQDYTARAQMSEALADVSAVKTAITDHYGANGDWPTTNAFQNLDVGRYVLQVLHTNNIITADFRADAPVVSVLKGTSLTLTAVTSAGYIVGWNCASSVSQKYVPQSCVEP